MNSFKCKLESIGWLAVNGDDAESFLHGQLSNDLRALDERHSQLHAYCNAKGRIICVLRIHRSEQGFLLQLPGELLETVHKRMQMYVLRAKVEIAPAACRSFGVCGDSVRELLSARFGEPPQHPGELRRCGALTVLTHAPGGGPRYQLIGTGSDLASAWEQLDAALDTRDERAWWRAEILAGIPRIGTASSEVYVPQMVNLDILGAVSFTKGCYPGQEIVARMRYLGKLKQRMRLAHAAASGPSGNGGTPPAPGTKVSAGQHPVGTVVDAEADGMGGFDLLLVLQTDLPAEAPLQIQDHDHLSVTLAELPYPLTDPAQRQA